MAKMLDTIKTAEQSASAVATSLAHIENLLAQIVVLQALTLSSIPGRVDQIKENFRGYPFHTHGEDMTDLLLFARNAAQAVARRVGPE